MSDLAPLRIWNDPAIRDSLSWCLDVAENRLRRPVPCVTANRPQYKLLWLWPPIARIKLQARKKVGVSRAISALQLIVHAIRRKGNKIMTNVLLSHKKERV